MSDRTKWSGSFGCTDLLRARLSWRREGVVGGGGGITSKGTLNSYNTVSHCSVYFI